MGDPSREITDDESDKFDAKKSEAMAFFSDGEWEKAIGAFTEAIELNANSAMPFVKRGQSYLKVSKPNACIRDCTRAIEINPDNAAAHKFRGRAHRLLGNFLEAAQDLRLACKIDFDDQADEWLREVTPNAKKIEEHERKMERKREEKKVAEIKERQQRAKEEREKAAQQAPPSFEAEAGDIPAGLGGLLNDPDLMAAFNDPEIAAAFEDITQNPGNILKYQGNPKVMKVLTKMASSMGGSGGSLGGLGGLGSMFGGMMGGMMGGGGRAPPPPPSGGGKPPSATDDLD